MKIRNGFVSNSSSSSFIIGLAKISDRSAVDNWISTLGLYEYAVKVEKVGDLTNCWRCKVKPSVKNNPDFDLYDVTIDSDICGDVTLTNLREDDYILVADISHGDDGDFWDADSDEYNYDIDLDFFPESKQDVYISIVNGINGLEKGKATFGAGRDG